jgi:hypothetical protein
VRIVFERGQTKLLSDPHDVRYAHAPRPDAASNELGALKAVRTRRQLVAIDKVNLSFIPLEVAYQRRRSMAGYVAFSSAASLSRSALSLS